jgi:hypothetical protein
VKTQTANSIRQTRRGATRSRTVPLLFSCLLALGLMSLLYLWQVAAATSASSDLQRLQGQQTELQRQDAALHAELGEARSPAYIEAKARAMGLAPADSDQIVIMMVAPGSEAGR